MRTDLTVVIITKNEAETIDQAVQIWGTIAPVLIVDSGSWDDTVIKAERAGARCIKQVWLGFGKQKQFAAVSASTDWVLSIDADEFPDTKLLEALQSIDLLDPSIAYSLSRSTYFLGSKIHWSGWRNDTVLRLFNTRHSMFNDRVVHEKVVHNGKIMHLSGELCHYSYRNVRDVKRKTCLYSRLAAIHAVGSNRKTPSVALVLAPIWSAFKVLVLKAGLLDGFNGIKIAVMYYQRTNRKYKLIKRLLT